LRLLWKTWRFLRQQPPRSIVASGGYEALLPGLLAPLLGRPLIVIEPNARPGKTNRLLACFASLVVIQFADARAWLAAGHVLQSGNPVRPIENRQRGLQQQLRILVMGGSLSATSINTMLLEALPYINKTSVEFVHLAGTEDAQRVEAAYREVGIKADVHSYVEDMPALYNSIDLAICRSGATSVSELCAAGIGALYIPLPWAADDHQTANARAVARVGGAVVLSQLSTDGRGLARIINRLSERRQEVTALGQNAARLARPDAARDIWQAMRDLHGVHHAVA
jgi:UDP-N-acetylglucosamine--N-acetylmuramyl-(pentapeptide) pyrophosphoryl-undecaprenol N-acetylglucosamine transferase